MTILWEPVMMDGLYLYYWKFQFEMSLKKFWAPLEKPKDGIKNPSRLKWSLKCNLKNKNSKNKFIINSRRRWLFADTWNIMVFWRFIQFEFFFVIF
jgi:hypothetical protein